MSSPSPPPRSCIIDANQAGNTNYNAAATQKQNGGPISKANQAITFTSTAPGSAVVGGATAPTPPARLGQPGGLHHRRLDRGRLLVINRGIVSFQAAGTCSGHANQAGNANYNV